MRDLRHYVRTMPHMFQQQFILRVVSIFFTLDLSCSTTSLWFAHVSVAFISNFSSFPSLLLERSQQERTLNSNGLSLQMESDTLVSSVCIGCLRSLCSVWNWPCFLLCLLCPPPPCFSCSLTRNTWHNSSSPSLLRRFGSADAWVRTENTLLFFFIIIPFHLLLLGPPSTSVFLSRLSLVDPTNSLTSSPHKLNTNRQM